MNTPVITVALAGNPNSGKTTMFNNMTGAHQKVGNWPGVTVEKKEGLIERFGFDLRIVDLPGTYSLTPFSIEEIVARNFVLEERPDVVIDIIDASNLERSLYLATQLREIDCRVLFALNMADMAMARGMKIDAEKLSELLDVPVVFTVGNRGEGVNELLSAAIRLAQEPFREPKGRRVKYSADIEAAIARLQAWLSDRAGDLLPYSPRWTAVKLLENDSVVAEKVFTVLADPLLREALEKLVASERSYIEDRYDDDPEIVMTDERYGFIAGIVKEVVSVSTRHRVDISRNIDRVLTNRFLGFPIFIFLIWAMFELTYSVGEIPKEWIGSGVELLKTMIERQLAEGWFKELLVNGVISGVGSVVVFLPNILILFLCISLFEDTGYMARAAFLMDKIMHTIGLHGKSFIPMLMGFGCNVPAIMAARTLESEKDRILTILITPFMSCSARLPIYIVIAGAFFAEKAGSVIFGIYLVGILLSIVTGRLLRCTLLKGQDAPFVMELPPYRVPMLKSVLIHMWERSKMFLKKMGNIILIGSIVVWALSAFPRMPEEPLAPVQANGTVARSDGGMPMAADREQADRIESERKAIQNRLAADRRLRQTEQSYMGRIGKWIEPVFLPIGIDWRGSVALMSGFVAKEIVVSTMGILYAYGGNADTEALSRTLAASGMTRRSALSFMVFVLIYLPCLATVAAIRRETGSIRWMMFSLVYSSLMAWVLAFAVYQAGRWIGW
ncbi:ferrous iron transport protein B [Desulfatirhabdium butyrativorans]|uniref:ferrous iron transport protein B n=1 Tax=Desulfatirhabdium butyrativorans TaxID=340467 RepID=UPI0004029E04|nr:ferrous iron transport protein B [Desulfatirhabdium butyrativorans]